APGATPGGAAARRRNGHGHGEPRVRVPEMLQQQRKHVEAYRHPARQVQRPRQRARPIGDRPNRVAEILEHAVAELHERFGRRRHAHLTADTQEERLAELVLEEENLAADRRLRDVQLPSARAERARLRDRLQDLELTQIHDQTAASARCHAPTTCSTICATPAPWTTCAKTTGPSARIACASRAMTSRSAPTSAARS